MEKRDLFIKRAAVLLLKHRVDGLTDEEMNELKGLLAQLGAKEVDALLKEMLGPYWLRDNYKAYEEALKHMESKEEALKKVWERIRGMGN